MSHPLAWLLERSHGELVAEADALGIDLPTTHWRDGLIAAIAGQRAGEDFGCGVLEVHEEGFGFLRSPYDGLLPGNRDIYVSQSQIKRFGLRTGDTVIGRIRPPKEQERYAALLRVDLVNGEPPDVVYAPFEQLAAIHPTTRLPLTRDPWLATVDWVAPLGLGSRGLVVGPARSERSEVLRRLATAFAGDERLAVTVLLAGERPEEVTDWREGVDVEIVATPLEELPAKHLQVADIVFERARRQAERGVEVLLLVDSLSRLLRHAAADAPASGHALEGVDAGALQRLRRWFATGRDLRDAGSVTVIGVIDGDPADPLSAVLRRELSDAASWQLALRAATGRRPRPSVDVDASWTRRDDLLLTSDELERRRRWRATVHAGADPDQALGELFRPAPLDVDAGAGAALDTGSRAGQ